MNDTPTSGPMSTSITQKERDVMSSRHSFRSSHFQASREGKEDLFEIRRQAAPRALLGKRSERIESSFGGNPAAAQQHEAVADLRRVSDLVDRQKEGPIRGDMLAQRR